MSEQDVLDKIDDAIELMNDVMEKINETKAEVLTPRPLKAVCSHCHGDGLKAVGGGLPPVACPDCNGTGWRVYGEAGD